MSGSCRQFQMGLKNTNFAIDTIGEYCQCNLIDSSVSVKNPKGIRLKECETCEYKNFIGCKVCGSEVMTVCNFYKEYARVAQEFEQLRYLLNMSLNNHNDCCQCKQKEPIYCIKNYQI